MAFKQFYDRRPALVKKRINRNLKKTQQKKQTMTAFIDEVKTLKRLKKLLTIRYDSFRGGWL
jgi:hypothetical protein